MAALFDSQITWRIPDTGAACRSWCMEWISMIYGVDMALLTCQGLHTMQVWLQYHEDPLKARSGSVLSAADWRMFEERGKKRRVVWAPALSLGMWRADKECRLTGHFSGLC